MEIDMVQPRQDSRTRLLDATLKVVRAKGYSATRIEDICTESGLTKGSFFHHFKSKEDLAFAAIAHWDAYTESLFAAAAYHDLPDPLDRLKAYIECRKAMLTGALRDYTCFAGTILQEAYATHPGISAACARNIARHAETLEADIGAAIRKYGMRGDQTATSLALHIQAVVQGGFILAKATGSAARALESLDHLRRYLELLFAGAISPAPAGRT